MRERRSSRQDSNSEYEPGKARQFALRSWAGAHALIKTITEKQAEQGNGGGRRRAAGPEPTEHAGTRVGNPGGPNPATLTERLRAAPGTGQTGSFRTPEASVRGRCSLPGGHSGACSALRPHPPTSGAQRLAQVSSLVYWRSCGACVLCGARVRSAPGQCLSEENGVARGNSRLEVFGGARLERRERREAGTRACAVGMRR